MRYRLRTLLILLAVAPPLSGLLGPRLSSCYNKWRKEREEMAEFQTAIDQVLAEAARRRELLHEEY